MVVTRENQRKGPLDAYVLGGRHGHILRGHGHGREAHKRCTYVTMLATSGSIWPCYSLMKELGQLYQRWCTIDCVTCNAHARGAPVNSGRVKCEQSKGLIRVHARWVVAPALWGKHNLDPHWHYTPEVSIQVPQITSASKGLLRWFSQSRQCSTTSVTVLSLLRMLIILMELPHCSNAYAIFPRFLEREWNDFWSDIKMCV